MKTAWVLLDTQQADAGLYTVTASVNPSASLGFFLDASRRIHPQEGQGTIFNVPGGISSRLYLPLVSR